MGEFRQVKVKVNVARPSLSQVVDAETGQMLFGVQSVYLDLTLKHARLVVDLLCEVEIEGEAQIQRLRAKPDGTFEPIEEVS